MESVCCSNPKRSPEVSTAMAGLEEAVEVPEAREEPGAGVASEVEAK